MKRFICLLDLFLALYLSGKKQSLPQNNLEMGIFSPSRNSFLSFDFADNILIFHRLYLDFQVTPVKKNEYKRIPRVHMWLLTSWSWQKVKVKSLKIFFSILMYWLPGHGKKRKHCSTKPKVKSWHTFCYQFPSLFLPFLRIKQSTVHFQTQWSCQTSTTVSSCPVRVTMILVLQLYQWTFLFKLIGFSITTCFSLERRYRPCRVKGSGVASQQRQRKSLIYA